MGMMSRMRKDEGGYALITAMLVLMILTLLVTITLASGTSVNNLAERGTRYTRVLGVAEAGLDDAVSRLSVDRNAVTSDCPTGSQTDPDSDPETVPNDVCLMDWGEYEVSWTNVGNTTTVTAVGYYPSKGADNVMSREIQAVYEPEPAFKYALFSASSLELKNNSVVFGDVYGAASILWGNGTHLCGSANTPGAITGGGGTAAVEKTASHDFGAGTVSCTDGNGDLWSGGSITSSMTVAGNVKSSGTATCANVVSGQTITGTATSCGAAIASTAAQKFVATTTNPPTADSIPAFTFNSGNYPGIHCYGAGGSCLQTAASATQVSSFNTATGNGDAHSGTYAVWTNGSCLGGAAAQNEIHLPNSMTITGDLTIITNARIDMGNQVTLNYTGSGDALVTLISLCNPSPGSTCTVNNDADDCAIYAENGADIVDGTGDLSALLYTTGPMAIKNNGVEGGAIYAGTLSVKNNVETYYDSGVAKILGFGNGLVRISWKELDG